MEIEYEKKAYIIPFDFAPFNDETSAWIIVDGYRYEYSDYLVSLLIVNGYAIIDRREKQNAYIYPFDEIY